MSLRRAGGWLLVVLLVLAGSATAQAPESRAAGGHAPRAVWTWERPSYAMLESPQVADDALAFLQRKRIDSLYLYADAYQGRNLLVQQPQHYQALIRAAHARGMRVYALLGSWYLHTERYVLPGLQHKAVAMLQRVLDYNAAAPADARFDGVNYDIEPHMLDAWNETTRPRLLRGFLDMTAAMLEARRKSGQALPVGPAMPFWWDGISLEWRGVRKPPVHAKCGLLRTAHVLPMYCRTWVCGWR